MTRIVRLVTPLLSAILLLGALSPTVASAGTAVSATRPVVPRATYHNPLAPTVRGDGTVDSCADPTVVRGRGAQARRWYMYCTTDPLNDRDTAGSGPVTFHALPTMVSRDLVHWRYVRDALPTRPSWASPTAALWAPDVVWSRVTRRYYLTFVVTDTADAVSGEPGCATDSAIGVATSRTPTGPWTVSDQPVVAPRRAGPGCTFFWTYDPDVLGESVATSSVLYYGSYFGGIFAQRVTLDATGMVGTGAAARVTRGQQVRPAVDPVAQQRRAAVGAEPAGAPGAADQAVAIPNRYEGANVVRHGGWYYLFASASNCCNGPLTGYSVFAGRSRSPLGPFTDREGRSLLDGRVGGTPVLSMNGNRWVGTGHNTVFRDLGGQWWTVYHAVDRSDPYFRTEPGFTKRPALLDPVDWVDGWPSVRSGRWASDRRMPAPAAQPGQRTAYRPSPVPAERRGARLARFSDEFDGTALDSRWTWVRPPAPETFGVQGGRFRLATQAADLNTDTNDASVLTEPAPRGDYVVQTRVHLDVPVEPGHNFVQAGLLVYGSDDAFLKLADVSIFETQQTEWAKEVWTAPPLFPRYGNTVVGAPGDQTWLRIVRRTSGHHHLFTAYTRSDGERWVRGGTWVHDRLGQRVRIGLVAMGGSGYTATFDHVRVWALR
jgi:arabinan endo-1,5-alpha-L-arabinosidase